MNKITRLSNGVIIPHLGLGTYPLRGDELRRTIKMAFKIGYRLIDTADNYYNESDLGDSLKLLYDESGAKREELFLVSKISDELYEPGSLGEGTNKGKFFWRSSCFMQKPSATREIVRMKIESTLSLLKTDYIDLYLMHWPYPDYFEEIWHAMEELYNEGKVRAVGVCNCRERHLEKLIKNCNIIPMVNQFETSPINTKTSLVEYCENHNVKIMVYSPLMSLSVKNVESYHDYLTVLSHKYNCSPAQIILRFDLQRGLIPIPKSSHLKRLEENFAILDFEISNEEMKQLYSYNIDYQYLPESKSCPGL